MTTLACFSFDNMGEAADIGDGRSSETPHPSLATGYPRLLDLLDQHGVRSTFFLEGWNGAHHPADVRTVVDRGHELGMHGWVHERWSELAEADERAIAERATVALRDAAGTQPLGFRAPGGSRTSNTEAILHELGYQFDASLADRDGAPAAHRLPGGLPCVPFVWSGVDGYWYLRADPAEPAVVRNAWCAALERATANDGLFVLVCHAFITGAEQARLEALADVVATAVADPRVRVCTVGEAAATIN